MDSKVLIPIVLVVAIAGAGAALLVANSQNPSDTNEETPQENRNVEEDSRDRLPSEMDSGENPSEGTTLTMDEQTGSGDFIAYSESNLTDGTNIIFFAADWCPTCQALKEDIESRVSEIPPGITILEADFDEEVDLKREYGITTQHSFVLVDQDGNEIKQWLGSNSLDALLAQVT